MCSPLTAADAAAHATLRARGVDPALWDRVLPAVLSPAERNAIEAAFDAAHLAYHKAMARNLQKELA
jgi:hypothetical protein